MYEVEQAGACTCWIVAVKQHCGKWPVAANMLVDD
jgi:hypothetical protein